MNDLYVDEAARGQGVGRALIEASAAVARERGAHHLEWATAPDNQTAQRLYDSTGAERSDLDRVRAAGRPSPTELEAVRRPAAGGAQAIRRIAISAWRNAFDSSRAVAQLGDDLVGPASLFRVERLVAADELLDDLLAAAGSCPG